MNSTIDKFSRHEALHTTHVPADVVERHLMNHPAVQADPLLLDHAERAAAALSNLYQAIGQDPGDRS